MLFSGPVSAGDWPQFRGDAEQRGVLPASALPLDLQPVWTYEIGEYGTESTAAIAGGKVFVAGLDGKVSALALATGKELWSYEIEDEIKSSPLVIDQTVYIGDEYGRMHALNTEDGKPRWIFEAESSITGAANYAPGGCLIFGSYDAMIYCLKPTDGSVVWKAETDGYVHGSPAISNGTVISGGCDGMLRLLDAETGAVQRNLEIGSYVASSPAVAAGHAIFGTFDFEVLAVDLAAETLEKAVLWRYRNAEREFPYYSSAAVTDELAILGGRDKSVHAIDLKTGEARWTKSFRGRIDASPIVVGDRVYVADKAGKLLALALADGKTVWEFDTGDAFAASPAIGGGHLVIGTEGGVIYAFTGKSTPGKNAS